MASNSKLFTVLALGLFVEDEAYPIKWDSKVKDVIPEGEWVLQDKLTQDHTSILDLLSHRTGLPLHDLMYDRTDTLKSLVSYLPSR